MLTGETATIATEENIHMNKSITDVMARSFSHAKVKYNIQTSLLQKLSLTLRQTITEAAKLEKV
jgi:hypothetical protein